MSPLGPLSLDMSLHDVCISNTLLGKRLTELGMYRRLTKKWARYKSGVQTLMLDNIGADLARRIAASVKLVESESTELSELEEEEEFQAELEKDLKYSLDRLNTPRSKRQCTSRSWRDSSVESRDPLELRIDDAVDGGDSGDDEL